MVTAPTKEIDMTLFTQFRHSDDGIWSAEASELGFAPGDWPQRIDARLGDVIVSGARRSNYVYDGERDLLYVDYHARGVTLRVWND